METETEINGEFATIKHVWTGQDKSGKPIWVAYFEEEDIKVRGFGMPKVKSGDEVFVYENEKGFWNLRTDLKNPDAKKKQVQTQVTDAIKEFEAIETQKRVTRAVAWKIAVEIKGIDAEDYAELIELVRRIEKDLNFEAV